MFVSIFRYAFEAGVQIVKKAVGSIFVPKVVMKELDQREKGNVPGITQNDMRRVSHRHMSHMI